MSATTNFSPVLVARAPARGDWRGRFAPWLARLVPARRRTSEAALPEGLGDHMRRDLGLPPCPMHAQAARDVGGLMWR